MKKFVTHPVFIIISVLVIFSLVIATVDAVSGYSYKAKIFIENSTASDITSRYLVTVPAKNLVDNHYIQSDAEDVTVEYSEEEPITAKNLTSNTAIWIIDYATVPAYSTISKTMYFGNSSGTRNQSWIADDGDSNYAADSASLDATSSVKIGIDQFILSATPSSEQEIVSKEGNYELVVDGTPAAKLKVWKRVAAPTATSGSPTDNYSIGEITVSGAATHWEAVKDGSDVSYIVHNGGGAALTQYAYFDWDTSAIPKGAIVNTVTVYWRDKNLNFGALSTYSAPGFSLNGTISFAAEVTGTNAWVQESAIVTRPGGGSWATEDLENGYVGIKLRHSITLVSPSAACSQIRVLVSYTSGISGPYTVSIPVAVGIPYTLSGSFTGTLLGVSNGSASSSMALSGTLNANLEPLHVAEYNGKTRGIAINKTPPAWPTQAEWEFEPDEISATVINDLSGNANHITYSLAANPAGITVTLGGAESTGETIASSIDIETQDTLPDGASFGGEKSCQELDSLGSNNPLFPLVDILHEQSNMPYQTAWMAVFMFAALFAFVMIMKYTQHLWLGGIAVAMIACMFYAWGGLIPFYLVAMAVMAAIASVILERRGTV